MLLENVALTPEAMRHFRLSRSPFVDDVVCREDVFNSPDSRYVRNALMQAAVHQGFVAVIGESGSGKTTLREDLEERIRDEELPVKVVKPYVLAMEPTETRGTMMKSGNIAEAIARTLAPGLRLPSNPETCLHQVHELMRDSCRAGRSHLLLIEEAHRMPAATLKHLKGWMELKDGLRRLLGVCLIGQPELADLLSEHNVEVREIVQRCEKVTLGPLGDQLEAYVRHKLHRVGASPEQVLAPDAYDAVRARLTYVPRDGKARDAQSICYPLAVNNLLARAMVAAARNGWPLVDRAAVLGC
ncbi:MAG TPA: AAA family ATPase [Aquabacterium sp.]|nr:AAA family ATPase [Aquabacterium sp.]